MSASVYTQAGFGVRLDINIENFNDPKYDELKKFFWKHADKSTHKYYGDVNNFFSEENFDVADLDDVFSHVTFCHNTNHLADRSFKFKQPHHEIFAVDPETLVSFSEMAYADLSKRSFVNPLFFKQLKKLAPLVVENETPRWYVWNNIG